eukprot:Plantae.Rhodophyta-Hildenbrandia_rubra.ctg27409.p1 GENE.Plantae.Rhodophyta-Hildenbrandia_rubra.ctg27409~~Plantae.Rhodophyta-Hildenbrandia_rubra.ctg27409.p1  ORF type:complete len:541 (+),score=83.74 Plantae.Rhodophyta-Hildenbrandia_rubra.ctg27409:1803-3425(+)
MADIVNRASPGLRTTADLFKVPLPDSFFKPFMSSGRPSKVGEIFFYLARKFEWLHYPPTTEGTFEQRASRVLTGDKAKPIANPHLVAPAMSTWENDKRRRIRVDTEKGLSAKLNSNVLSVANDLLEVADASDDRRWTVDVPKGYLETPGVEASLEPDFICVSGGENESEAVGELKTPKVLDLQKVTPMNIQEQLSKPDFLDNKKLKPLVQIFAQMYMSRTGKGVFSTYELTTFLQMDLGERKVYMSHPISCKQTCIPGSRPHLLQALLHTLDEDATEGIIFNDGLKMSLYHEAQETRRYDRSMEEGRGSASGSRRAQGGAKKATTDPKRGGRQEKGMESSHLVFGVLSELKKIRRLGSGLCGALHEFWYGSTRVAAKFGAPYNPDKHEADMFEHVENEARVLEKLSGLQGDVVPKVIVAGVDTYYNTDYMCIVRESVGVRLKSTEEGIVAGEEKLKEEAVQILKEKAKEALGRIHDCNVIHGDPRLENIVVEMRHGKISRLWWIDFGMAYECAHKAMKDREICSMVSGIDDAARGVAEAA